MTPTARSLKLLREWGFAAQVVEQTVAGKFKRDLFGIMDIVAIRPMVTERAEIFGVQATSAANHSARVKRR